MGNPEGTDFSFDVDHEKEFSQEQFDAVVEEAFVYALEKRYKENGFSFVSSVNSDYIYEYLQQKGFVRSKPPVQSYYLEPYWGKKRIRSEKLLAWVDQQGTEEAPKYFQKDRII
jgi:hypothetical protein